MLVDVALLPEDMRAARGKSVVVLDVLRATTSMAAALAVGVKAIRVFADLDAARQAAAAHSGPKLLCGERNCLPPAGFDLGNSPGDFTKAHAGATLFMSTTNGTRAILAAQGASGVLTGAIVNAAAVAGQVRRAGRDVVLLCAGTEGRVALEDVLGTGAVIVELRKTGPIELGSDIAQMAIRVFLAGRGNLRRALSESQGGRNVIQAGLEKDIAFAARLNALAAVGVLRRRPLRIVPA